MPGPESRTATRTSERVTGCAQHDQGHAAARGEAMAKFRDAWDKAKREHWAC